MQLLLTRCAGRRALILAAVFNLLLVGCHPTYYIKVTSLKDPSHPCFSISQSRFLPWAPGMWSHLIVSEVDKTGKQIKLVWQITPIEKVNVKAFCYGKAPDGYKETTQSVPLALNTFYEFSLSGEGAYLKLSDSNGHIEARVYSRSEFFDEIVYPTEQSETNSKSQNKN